MEQSKNNIAKQLKHQIGYMDARGYKYKHQKDMPFIEEQMALHLSQAGIKDLRQLGTKATTTTYAIYKKGDKYFRKESPQSCYSVCQSKEIEIPASKLSNIREEDGFKTELYGGTYGTHGLSGQKSRQVKTKVLKADVETGYELINKDTGEKVVQGKYHGNLGYGKESDDPREGLRWGNTTSVEGMADYMIAFDANDQAIIYPKYEDTKSGFVAPLLTAAAIATTFVAPGVGASIGKAVGLSGKVATTFGNAMVGGTLSKAGGGAFFKGALLASIPSVVSEIVPTSTIDNISKTTNISTKTITSGFEKSVSHGLRNIVEGKSFTDGIDQILLSEGIQGEVVPKIKSFVDNKFTPDVVDSIKNQTFTAAEDFYKQGNEA